MAFMGTLIGASRGNRYTTCDFQAPAWKTIDSEWHFSQEYSLARIPARMRCASSSIIQQLLFPNLSKLLPGFHISARIAWCYERQQMSRWNTNQPSPPDTLALELQFSQAGCPLSSAA